MKPVEIVGGGLAGLSLAVALRRHQVPVTLFEAGGYPRHRVCGEFITGLKAGTVQRLGLEPVLADALRHQEVAWFYRKHPVRRQRLPSPALGLSRHALDARLAAAFVAAGGELRTSSRIGADAWHREGVVNATGRRRGPGRWLGLKCHVHDLDVTRDLEVHLGTDAYVGLSRVETGAVNVCGLFARRAVAGRGPSLLIGYLQAAGLDELARRLQRAAIDEASFCAIAALDFRPPAPSPERIELGDAWAMIPPFTGNGMAMAFQSAECAVDPLADYARGNASWTHTCRAIHRRMHERFRLRLTSAAILHPFLLQTPRQRLLAGLTRARLLPLTPLYAVLH